MQTLRDALRTWLRDWRDDLSPAWREVVADVEPAIDSVRADLELGDDEVIFPGRRDRPVPGAPAGAHVFRALDGVHPRDVRVVVVGQDPYPRRSQATGRAFEQGDLDEWPAQPSRIADSLARIVQCVAQARTGDDAYVQGDAAWARVHADREAPLDLEPPRALFDRWQRQGVLFLNTGLTLSRFAPGGSPEQLEGHLPLWRPVVQRIFTALARRDAGHVVFATWGAPARRAFATSGVREAAVAAGRWRTRVDVVEHPHPNARVGGTPSFLQPPNPLVAVDDRLRSMGAEPIAW